MKRIALAAMLGLMVLAPAAQAQTTVTYLNIATGKDKALLEQAAQEFMAANPGITAGDVDADWVSAYSTGDEAPGGDMPTPDQDIVEEIGKSLGLVYEDNEELKGVSKIEERDKHRWELDPASSEAYEDRD